MIRRFSSVSETGSQLGGFSDARPRFFEWTESVSPPIAKLWISNSQLRRPGREELIMGNPTAIVGLGYVGLPLSLQFCRKGMSIVGLDIDLAKVEKLNRGG